jgi:ParB family chromosome partitioning protein
MNEKEEPKTAGTNLIRQIPLSELVPFKDHPFRIVEDEAMLRITESISEYGVLTPIIARPKDGGYEIISGHRRAYAAKQAGLKEVPVIVKELNDDEATVLMVDSNFQRERILPSERAFAYKMKMEALRHQGERTDLSSAQVAPKLSTEIIAEDAGISKDSVKRYIRLTNLIPDILTLVDEGKIGFTPAVELSYLKPEEQEMFLEAMDYAQASPSLSQAQRMKKLSQEGRCTPELFQEIMYEVKKDDLERVTFRNEQLRKYFPKSYSIRQMQDTIMKLLEQWQKRRSREMER